jgi:hypothetical protein
VPEAEINIEKIESERFFDEWDGIDEPDLVDK